MGHKTPKKSNDLSRVVEESKEQIWSAESISSSKKKPHDSGIAVESVKSIIASEGSKEISSRPQSDVSPSLDSDKRELMNSARIISSVGSHSRNVQVNSDINNSKEVEEEKEPNLLNEFPQAQEADNNLNQDEGNVDRIAEPVIPEE